MNLGEFSSNTGDSRPVISVIVPFYNERQVLPLCLDRLEKVLGALGEPFEVVFVDDGSDDGGDHYLIAEGHARPWLQLVRLSRNFGTTPRDGRSYYWTQIFKIRRNTFPTC